MTTVGDEPFKLNNSFVSLYTRLMIDVILSGKGSSSCEN